MICIPGASRRNTTFLFFSAIMLSTPPRLTCMLNDILGGDALISRSSGLKCLLSEPRCGPLSFFGGGTNGWAGAGPLSDLFQAVWTFFIYTGQVD